MWHSRLLFEFERSIEIRRWEQVGGRNARGVRLAHGQHYMRMKEQFKRLQECSMQIVIPHQECCII